MRWGLLLAIAALLTCSTESPAQGQQEIDKIANTMVRLCVGGGSTSAVSGGGDAGVDLSLRSLDATGKINGEFRISKKSAEGLVEGLNNAIGAVAADQADKVRTCLQPVRERLLDLMLPIKKSSQSNEPSFELVNSVLKKTFTFGLGERHVGTNGVKGVWGHFACDCITGDFWHYTYSWSRNSHASLTFLTNRNNVIEGIRLVDSHPDDVRSRALLTLYGSLRRQWGDQAKYPLVGDNDFNRDSLRAFQGVRYHYQYGKDVGEAILIALDQ